MNSEKYRMCGNLKKSECVELLKTYLSFDELKELISPMFLPELLKMLEGFNKKNLQFTILNNNSITPQKIKDIIYKETDIIDKIKPSIVEKTPILSPKCLIKLTDKDKNRNLTKKDQDLVEIDDTMDYTIRKDRKPPIYY